MSLVRIQYGSPKLFILWNKAESSSHEAEKDKSKKNKKKKAKKTKKKKGESFNEKYKTLADVFKKLTKEK